MCEKLTFKNAPEYLRTSQAATLANVHLNSIQSWILDGRLPATRIPGSNRWRIKLADLKEFIGYNSTLPAYADWLETVLDLPAGKMKEALEEIIADMRSK